MAHERYQLLVLFSSSPSPNFFETGCESTQTVFAFTEIQYNFFTQILFVMIWFREVTYQFRILFIHGQKNRLKIIMVLLK
jgi:hypothetical protein